MSKKTVITRATRGEIDKAQRIFTSFSGHELDREYHIKLPDDDVVFAFGEVWSIGYHALRDGAREKYLHEFQQKSRPILASNLSGDQLYLIGGSYKFGARGIVDK